MTRPLTVRDRHGNLVERADGVMLDGDKVQEIRVPMMFADSAPTVTAATLASAATILGDAYDRAEIANLTDIAARHAVVRKRIGSDAEGRPAAYLDAAWDALAGTGSPAADDPKLLASLPVLTDAQKAFAAESVKRALADHAGAPAAVKATDGAKAARNHLLCDAWKSDSQRAEEGILDGLSYTERMALTSGAPPSYVKASDRKVSDAEFYSRRRQLEARRGSAA